MNDRPTSAFAKYESKTWPHRYRATLLVDTIAGGIPADPHVAEVWLKTKGFDKDDLIREQIAEIMAERQVTADEAIAELNRRKHLNGFKRDDHGLYYEGRQMKAALKEAASIAVATGKVDGRKWGATNKGLKAFFAETVMVEEDRIYLGVTEPTGVAQRFISTFRGTGIQYEEYVEDAKLTFHVKSAWNFTEAQWGAFWLIGQEQGIGASRSQGFGRYTVTEWVKA